MHSDKEKQDEGPNFKTSGKLAAETNTYKVSVIMFVSLYILSDGVGSSHNL